MEPKPKIGFIGQGFIGKNYADSFESRGFDIVRYSLEKPYVKNGGKIKDCNIVFIAVPTPTTPSGFRDKAVRDALSFIGKGKIAVIKSTILPGRTEEMQKMYPDIFVVHSPEFLTRETADKDAYSPKHNIIGIPKDTKKYQEIAQTILGVLPKSDSTVVCHSRDAELFKYARNCFFYNKIVFINILYDLSNRLECNWDVVRKLLGSDIWIANKHLDPVDQKGRGGGGPCFIKDFAAFKELYKDVLGSETSSIDVLEAIERKNVELLRESIKDLDLVDEVYGAPQDKNQ